MKTIDTYNLTTLDANGEEDLIITGMPTYIAQSWIKELEADGVKFYIELVTKTVEETV